MPSTDSSSLNWASSPTNCVGSVGLVGSWYFICATSNCRNSDSVGAGGAVEAEEELLVDAEDPVVPAAGAVAAAGLSKLLVD